MGDSAVAIKAECVCDNSLCFRLITLIAFRLFDISTLPPVFPDDSHPSMVEKTVKIASITAAKRDLVCFQNDGLVCADTNSRPKLRGSEELKADLFLDH
jgi:hypothetical protein